ncbi:MAG: alpha/beta hydrolase, partial [Pirellulales bacterium]|nr:alpha/beta hydrolase [Pirellulales bacterium]
MRVAVLHGGPGALGGMAPVARELAAGHGVLEPIQRADSIAGQVEELRGAIVDRGSPPLVLIGSSWGAMLGFIFSARHPELVRKLILVGSGVYEEASAARIQETRVSRLSHEEQQLAETLAETLDDPAASDKDRVLARLGGLMTKADAYDPAALDTEAPECSFPIHRAVWSEAQELRRSGELLGLAPQIRCPVVAIHGDYDPHPAEGIQSPLSSAVNDFRFILLKNCGHLPWIERQAKDEFFALLRR